MHDRLQRRHREGRHLLPDHGQEAPARAGDRGAEPPALHLPGRQRRREPAEPGRGVSRPRPFRPDLLQPGQPVGAGHPADRGGDGLLHGRRRLCAGDVGRDRDRPPAGHDLSGRPAARQGRDRRGGERRGARRRRPPQPRIRRHRPLRPRRCPCARDHPADRRQPQPPQADRARPRPARGPALSGERDLRPRAAGPEAPVRRARGDRAARRRLALRRVQDPLRPDAGDRLRAADGHAGRHPRQQRRAVPRIRAQGRALHRALLPARHPADLPAEHHGLHGRAGNTRRAASPRTAPSS